MKRLAQGALLLLLSTCVLPAQTPLGSLEGVVRDETRAVIPGASVKATHRKQTTITRSVLADQAGRFSFAAMQPGTYLLEVGSAGFRSVRIESVVHGGRATRVEVVLQIGAVNETIEVSGAAATLQTSVASTTGVRRSGPAEFNTEEYSHIAENRFHSPVDAPLSTFSIDVDTASYANVRRFLNDGRLPPHGAVRIEELVNYFRYDDPLPSSERPFRISSEVMRCPWNSENQLVRLALRSRSIAVGDLPPANLVFLLDVSGSMNSPDKLPLLRKAFALLVGQLRPQDRVAVAVYAGSSGLVLPSTSGDQQARIVAAVERLRPGGATAGAAGIRLAYQVARENFVDDGNNRVILATDGDFNVGVSSQSELVELIERERESGVFPTVLGFGTGNLKDSKMEQLADNGNGSYHYIDSLLEARRALVEQIGATLTTVAQDVKLQVEFNPARVKKYRLIGYENRLLEEEDFDDDLKDAGEMGAGHSVTALYEVRPRSGEPIPGRDLRYQDTEANAKARHSDELLNVKVRYKEPRAERSLLITHTVPSSLREVAEASPEIRLAAAAAAFGLLLRDSNFKGDADFEQVVELAEGARGSDRDGTRTELALLAKTAARLVGRTASSQAR